MKISETMQYRLWDKQESFNNVEVEKIKEAYKDILDDTIILISLDNFTSVQYVQSCRIINANARGTLFNDLDSEEVKAEKVFNALKAEQEEQEKLQEEEREIKTLEKAKRVRMASLPSTEELLVQLLAENKAMKEELVSLNTKIENLNTTA